MIVLLVVIALVVWLVNTYLPVPKPFKTIIIVLIIVLVCLWLLSMVGQLPSLGIGR